MILRGKNRKPEAPVSCGRHGRSTRCWDGCSVRGSCLCAARREGKGSQELGTWEMELWVPPAAQSTQQLLLTCLWELGSERSCSETRWGVCVLCSVLCPFPCPSLSVPCEQRFLGMDIIQRPCRSSWVPEAGWVRCWSAKILGWAVSDPFKSDLDECAGQDIVLGTLSCWGAG